MTHRRYPYAFSTLGIPLVLALLAEIAVGATLIATIPVGARPHGVAVNPLTNRIYVANYGGGTGSTVSVIDGATNTVIDTINIFANAGPFGVSVNPGTNRLYVANHSANSVSVVDLATHVVLTSVAVGNLPEEIGINVATNKMYVTNWNGGGTSTVSVIDGGTNTNVATIPTGDGPNGVAVDPATNRVFVTNFTSGTISIIDGATDTVVDSITPVNSPNGIKFDSTTNRLFVSNFGPDRLTVFDATTKAVLANIALKPGAPFDYNPDGVALSPFGYKAYVSNTRSTAPNGHVSVVNPMTGRVEEEITIGREPREAAFNPLTRRLYVPNFISDTLSVIEDTSDCCSLSATDPGDGTITVTGAGRFEMRFNTATSGGIDLFYDLVEDPARSFDLAGGTTEGQALHGDGIEVAGNFYQVNTSNSGAKLDLLEATPARVVVRQDSFYKQESGTAILPGIKAVGDYSIYPSGRHALRWNQRATSPVTYTIRDLDLFVHRAGAPLNGWTPYSQTDGTFPNPGGDDFVLVKSDVPQVRTDFLTLLNRDWTNANGYLAQADAVDWYVDGPTELGNPFWEESTGAIIPAGNNETHNFLTYFKPTNLIDHTDVAVTSRSTDYRAPATLTINAGKGSQWQDASENTSAVGDFFNESEAAYVLELNPATGLDFDLTGTLALPRYEPFFKVRQWRSLAEPASVTLDGTTLTRNVDYLAVVKPVSRAHWAAALSWHCTLEGAASCDSANLDAGASGSTAVGAIQPGKYGNAGEFTANTHNFTAGSTGNADFSRSIGAVDFWYQPYYNDNDGNRYLLWYNSSGAGTFNCFSFVKTATNQLVFTVVSGATNSTCTSGGTTYSVTAPAASFSWRARDWVHLKTTWNASGGTKKLRIVMNGVELDFSSTFVAPATHGPTIFGGCTGISCPANLPGNANGLIDEPHIYTGLDGTANDTPIPLAHGGLTSNADEYLATGARNFSMPFTAVDTSFRGPYFYVGVDSKFLGLNVGLATAGTGTPNLRWMFWNGSIGAWDLLETPGFVDTTNSFQQTGSLYWTTANIPNWAPYSIDGGPDLYYVRAYLDPGSSYSLSPTEAVIKPDILLLQYCGEITGAGQTFQMAPPLPTAVKLTSFEAAGLPGAVQLTWRTASELDNLGFHIYRSMTAAGPYQRVTVSPIPGLGSSPEGASYSYRDAGLAFGQSYFYELEDIETTGKTTRHGPVEATTLVETEGPEGESMPASALITYGDPGANQFRVVRWDRRGATVELVTEGFYAEPHEDGTVRITIPGFELAASKDSVSLPVKRPWLDAVAGVGAKIVAIEERSKLGFSSLRPSGAPIAALAASPRGVLHPRQRSAPVPPGLSGVIPAERARLLGSGFQGDAKRVQLELSPLSWNGERQELSLVRHLLVAISFEGRASEGRRARARRSSANVLTRLATTERGLHVVGYEDLFPGRQRRVFESSALTLLRLGEPVAYHVEPKADRFGPGSRLYFLSPGADANPYGTEAVFELSVGARGLLMVASNQLPAGAEVRDYRARVEEERDRLYQAGLLEAEDPWLWDVLFAPVAKAYAFQIEALALSSVPAKLTVRLQGASDFDANPDHHVRLLVNGTLVSESRWDGKAARTIEREVPPGVLREGENELTIENVGDTGAAYSMVMLDSFALEYSRLFEGGGFEGVASESGTVSLQGAAPVPRVIDVSDFANPLWLRVEGNQIRVDGGRRYLATDSPLSPAIRKPHSTGLARARAPVDYLAIAPRIFLDELEPLFRLRRDERLAVRAVAVEDIFEELGFGESRPEAIRDFLAQVFQETKTGASLRYVLLVGDATYDFKDYLGTGVVNRVPPWMIKTPYLWTASDPALASVNGEDSLPDVAIGRLPAASEEELRVMVEKILAYESSSDPGDGRMFLVTDNADSAGSFDAGADAIAGSVLRGRGVERIRLEELGVEAARERIRDAFDEGARLVSYVGHGGIHLWADENLLDLDGVADLTPQSEQPLLVTMNCLNGYFHFPYFDSLAEALLKAEDRGAIAAFSPSGLSLDSQAQELHRLLLDSVFNRNHRRLGDAILEAQREYASEGGSVEILAIYHLLGDPALRLRH